MKTKIRTHEIYSPRQDAPLPPLIAAFNELLEFPALEPATQMLLLRMGRAINQHVEDARRIQQSLLENFVEMDEAGQPVLVEDEVVWKDEQAFYDGLNALLNTEIEVDALSLSTLTTANQRYWQLFEKGYTNGTMPLNLLALHRLVYDDVTPPDIPAEAAPAKPKAKRK